MEQSDHLLGRHTIGINTLFNIFVKFFAFFKLNIISQKSDKNNTIRIIFIKVTITINIIKFYHGRS